MSAELRRVLGELVAVLVVSALVGAYLLSQTARPPGVPPAGPASVLAAFYYPLSFPVGTAVKALGLAEKAGIAVAVYATIVIQNVFLWLFARWVSKAAR